MEPIMPEEDGKMVKLIAGIDGGGTNTRLVAADKNGNIVFESTGGPSNLCSNSVETVEKSLAGLFHGLKETPDFICIGSAGAESQTNQELLRGILHKATGCKSENIIVTTDSAIALEAGLQGKPGISITAGTGSVCMGRNGSGETARAGGWGHIFSDEGSAYSIGAEGMRQVMAAYDKGEDTLLLREMLKATGEKNAMDISERIYAMGEYKSYVAKLAAVVGNAAQSGDSGAEKILIEAGSALAGLCGIVHSRLSFGTDKIAVVCNGSVLIKNRIVRDAFEASLSDINCTVRNNENPASHGALMLAVNGANRADISASGV